MLLSLLLAQLLLPGSPRGPVYSQPAELAAASSSSGAAPASGLLTGLERYYAFDGDGVDQASGQDATALNANTNYAAGHIGQSAGVNNDAAAGFHAPALNLMGDLSISFWVHTMSGGGAGYCPAVGQMAGGGGTFINYVIFQLGPLVVYETGNTAGPSGPTLTAGAWHHVVFVRNATTNIWSIYTDGAFYTSGGSVGPYSVPSPTPLQIMHRDDAYSSFGTWRMDELAIWSRKLTLAEVVELYNSGAGKAYPF